jgi:hypothetical protein
MSIKREVEVYVNKMLVQKVEQLCKYKAVADEVLSAINEKEFADPEMLRLQELALRALNIGAHNQAKGE